MLEVGMERVIPTVSGLATLSHSELVKLAKQRDSTTWSEIYSQYYEPVYRYVFGRLGRKELAEDLVAQVFLEALQSIDSYKDQGRPLLAWLYGIARNLVRNGARRRRRSQEADQEIQEQAEQDQRVSITLGGLSLDSLDLANGLSALSKEQREVLILRFFVGMSAKETGRIVGKTEQAVYSLQVRGIAGLRRVLTGEPRSFAKERAA
jgi:RNA polymerase sigma-70 factor (ECF subfamily)